MNATAAATLDELVYELLDWYIDPDEDPDGGRGLIWRLDDLALRTGQPGGAGDGGPRPTLGSRPPTRLDAVHWSTRIKTEAIALDVQLRTSTYTQPWEKAMRAIPAAAELAGDYKTTASTVGRWHSVCRTVLGLQRPALQFERVACLVCGQHTIYGRANHYKPRAWCTNPLCVDPDSGRPARYEGPRLYLLARNLTPRAS